MMNPYSIIPGDITDGDIDGDIPVQKRLKMIFLPIYWLNIRDVQLAVIYRNCESK